MPLKLSPGDPFPDAVLRDHTGAETTLGEVASGRPLLLAFYRGPW